MPYLSMAIRSTHAESEPRYSLRIVADELKNLWVDHTGAENFQPATAFANSAVALLNRLSVAAANHALNIDLSAGLCEREKTRAKSHPGFLAKHPLQKMRQHPFEIRERDVAIHHKTLHLVEHRRMSSVIIMAINCAWYDHLQRRLPALHGANLDR